MRDQDRHPAAEADALLIANENDPRAAAGGTIRKIARRDLPSLLPKDVPAVPRQIRLRLGEVGERRDLRHRVFKAVPASAKPETWTVPFMVSDWVEATVSWSKKDYPNGAAWKSPGAAGTEECSVPVATASYTIGSEAVFEVGKPAALALVPSWRTPAGALSLLVSPRPATVLIRRNARATASGVRAEEAGAEAGRRVLPLDASWGRGLRTGADPAEVAVG